MVVVVTMGREVVDLRAFGFARFELLASLFFGQFRAMCPVSRHLKHRPSDRYFVCSLSVSFLNGRDALTESTSMGHVHCSDCLALRVDLLGKCVGHMLFGFVVVR